MQATIYSMPISDLQKTDPQLNTNFFEGLLANHPELGVSRDNYFIINNHVNINIYANLPQVFKNFTIFVQMAATKAPFTQLLKNQ